MYHVTIPPLSNWQKFRKFAKSYTGMMTWISVIALVWAFLYKFIFVSIPAKWDFMPILGEIFFAVVLSIVASTVVLIVTIYIPERRKQKKVDAIVNPWLKQYRLLGDLIQIAIADKTGVCHDEFKSNCTQDFKSPITKESVVIITGKPFTDWFEFFDYIYEHEDVYYKKLTPYFTSMPVEIIEDMENLLMPDNFRGAVLNYRSFYGTGLAGIDYNHLTNLENVIWLHVELLRGLVERYQQLA